MKLKDVYVYGCKELEGIIDNSSLDAWYLLEFVMKIDRSYFYLHQDEDVVDEAFMIYSDLLKKRRQHIPLQHLTGTQEFMGIEFAVNEHVLIPRQDTEILVEEAEKYLTEGMDILDMCTGSGCILLSVLSRNAGVTGTGADISKEALKVAEANRRNLGVDAAFVESNMFEQISCRYDMILSNPPYIPSEVIPTLMDEVKDYEPLQALDGSEDGLKFYREIVRMSKKYLKPHGYLVLEIGCEQGNEVSEMLKEQGFIEIEVIKDLSGLDRVIKAVYLQPET